MSANFLRWAIRSPIPATLAALLLITFTLSAELREKHVFPRYAEMQQARTEYESALKARDFDKALLHGQKALALGLEIFTEDDPTLAELYNAVGNAWEAKGESNKAIESYRTGLKLNLAKLRSLHTQTARSYDLMAQAFKARGEHDKAIKTYEMALTLDLKKLSGEHPSVTYLYNSLGALWEMKGQCDKAVANYEKGMRYHRETDVPFKTNCYQK